MDNTKEQYIPRDPLLQLLSEGDGLVNSFVESYPGQDSSNVVSAWINAWFEKRSAYYMDEISREIPDDIQEFQVPESTPISDEKIVSEPYSIVWIHPHFFRGFRVLEKPVLLNEGLAVIEGRNSSGKTSLTEAIEWLLTGELIRRKLDEQGSPGELENCISNQLRPDNQDTWVEAEFISQEGAKLNLKRVLIADYGDTSTSEPKSELFRDGEVLSDEEERELIDKIFGGVPPLLMQHTLSLFVHSNPQERREYFERLLRLDELTYLISKAVVGDARLSEFSRPKGGIAWAKWEQMKTLLNKPSSKTILRKVERDHSDEMKSHISKALIEVAWGEFADLLSTEKGLEQIEEKIASELEKQRQAAFPILSQLKPQQSIDKNIKTLLNKAKISSMLKEFQDSNKDLESANEAAGKIEEAHIEISRAYEALSKAGLVEEDKLPQTCVLCNYERVPTLTEARINEIKTWHPLQKAITQAETQLEKKLRKLIRTVNKIKDARINLIPENPTNDAWSTALEQADTSIAKPAKKLREFLKETNNSLEPFDEAIADCLELMGVSEISGLKKDEVIEKLERIKSDFNLVITKGEEYERLFASLDNSISAQSRTNDMYNLMDTWNEMAKDIDAVYFDLRWEQAKKKSQKELILIRDELIKVRQKFLDARRTDFNSGINTVWETLREDRYSSFHGLNIPEPSGRGFPVEIEVKAILDDGTNRQTVDALRVFSESQINVLGLAAFIIRSKLIGHRLIMLDDPVQSMDEDHFKTFSNRLVPYLLESGFQVIILTHNDTFARELSYACIDIDGYTTLKIRHSRRKGVQIEEGNRRVSERLKMAEKFGEEGKFEDAWIKVRLAIERLYKVVYFKYGPDDFNPLSWLDQTAEYMWGNGAGEIIEDRVPGMRARLKDILDMAVTGAHNSSAFGNTDIQLAVKDLRSLLRDLRVGGG